MYTDPSGEFLDLALFLTGSVIMGGWFWGSEGDDFNWKKAWEGGFKTLLQVGGMVLGAYTATGPLSALANMTSAMHGNIGFGPFNYDIHEKDFSLGYGPFDYNISENELDYMFEKGNSDLENIMYGARTISFLSSVKEQHGSLFATDQDKTFGGKAWQLTSRFTWEYIQTRVAMDLYNIYSNLGGSVTNIHKGITELSSEKGMLSALSMGHVNVYHPNYEFALPHEFGHTLQSRILGPLYLPIALSGSGFCFTYDLIWNIARGGGYLGDKYYIWTEGWADELGKSY